MQIDRCDCILSNSFDEFCIEQRCQFSRRLCYNCANRHSGHNIISTKQLCNLLSSCCKSKNSHSKKSADIQKAFYVISTVKDKIVKELSKIIEMINSNFSSIEKKFKELNSIKQLSISYEDMWNIITSQTTTKQRLNAIAIQLNPLSKQYKLQNDWAKMIAEPFSKQLTELGIIIEQDLHQVQNITKKSLGLLSSFKDQYQNNQSVMIKADKRPNPQAEIKQQKHSKMPLNQTKKQAKIPQTNKNKKDKQKPRKLTKIADIEPGDQEINILAQVVNVEQMGNFIRCYLGDETGIVRAYFPKNKNLKKGNFVLVNHSTAQVFKSNIQIRVPNGGNISKSQYQINKPINLVNNISSKEWEEVAQEDY